MGKPYWLVVLAASWAGPDGSHGGEIPALEWPTALEGAKIAQKFGVPAAGAKGRIHSGLDIDVPKGTPVYAAADGKVRWARNTYLGVQEAGQYTGARKAVVIEHGAGSDRFVTSYGHVHYTVKEGQTVARGQQIGTVADWGGNTHLHFGIRNASFDSNPDLAIRGRALPGELTSFVDPMKHFNEQVVEEVIPDVAQQLADFFGGKPPKIVKGVDAKPNPRKLPKPPEPTPARPVFDPRSGNVAIPDVPDLERILVDEVGTRVYADPKGRFQLRIPRAWSATEGEDQVIFSSDPSNALTVELDYLVPGRAVRVRGKPDNTLTVCGAYMYDSVRNGQLTKGPVSISIHGAEEAAWGWSLWRESGGISERVIFRVNGKDRKFFATYSLGSAALREHFLHVLRTLEVFGD